MEAVLRSVLSSATGRPLPDGVCSELLKANDDAHVVEARPFKLIADKRKKKHAKDSVSSASDSGSPETSTAAATAAVTEMAPAAPVTDSVTAETDASSGSDAKTDAESSAEPSSASWFLPPRPLHREVARRLLAWSEAGSFPFSMPVQRGFEKSVNADALTKVFALTPLVIDTVKTVSAATSVAADAKDDSRSAAAAETAARKLLLALGVRGLMTLLGVHCTFGSYDLLPPSRAQLARAFNAPHSNVAVLTTGARALAKHCHRATGWWPICEGKDVVKNEIAAAVLKRILDGASWVNIHMLPAHRVPVIEIRVPLGYGARWAWRQPEATTASPSKRVTATAAESSGDHKAVDRDRDGDKDKAGAGSDADSTVVGTAMTPATAETTATADSSAPAATTTASETAGVATGAGSASAPPPSDPSKLWGGAELVFRGFLEPHMEDGHDKGWRH